MRALYRTGITKPMQNYEGRDNDGNDTWVWIFLCDTVVLRPPSVNRKSSAHSQRFRIALVGELGLIPFIVSSKFFQNDLAILCGVVLLWYR